MADKLVKHGSGGVRYDDPLRPSWDLIPAEAIEAGAKVYSHGAIKYKDARNWEKGLSWLRVFKSVMSHLWKWRRGEKLDPESGLSHLAHAWWNITALLYYEERSDMYGKWDDRIYPMAPKVRK